MRNALATAAAILLLGGCASSGTVDLTTARKSVYAAKSAYAAVLTVAVQYNALDRCGTPAAAPPPLCSDQSVIVQMRKADAAAEAALDAAETAVRSSNADPTVAQASVTAAQQAVTAFQQVVAIYAPK